MPAPLIDKEGIRALIPHAADMCLLDSVHAWDAERILCASDSHRLANHPLRRADGVLGGTHLIEYAAQAAAVHGGLLAALDGVPTQPGYLAAVRQCRIGVASLDGVASELMIDAQRLFASAGGWIYEFTVCGDDRALAYGQFTIAHLAPGKEATA